MALSPAEKQKIYRARKRVVHLQIPDVKPDIMGLLAVVDELWEARQLSSPARIRLRAEIKARG